MTANEPWAGADSRDEGWSRQRVERDARLIDRLTADDGETAEAEAGFDARSAGRRKPAVGHGDHIDLDHTRSASRDDAR
jgi:hypothetical protein